MSSFHKVGRLEEIRSGSEIYQAFRRHSISVLRQSESQSSMWDEKVGEQGDCDVDYLCC